MSMSVLKGWSLDITMEQILRGQGIDPQIGKSRTVLREAAEWALEEGMPLIAPAVTQEILEVREARHERLRFEGGVEFTGRLVTQHLAGSSQVVVMICTLGAGLEDVIAGLLESDPHLGMAMEGFGIAAIEALATAACRRIEEQAGRQGLFTSIPLSPGMVGWPADKGQKQIFRAADGGAIGVRLNASGMMIPRMSLTEVMGIGRELMIAGRTCDYCSLRESCQFQDHYS